MYINVGIMKNDPNKNGMTIIRFTRIAIPTSFYIFVLFCNIKVCVLLEHVLISYTGSVCCRCWKQASAKWQSSESLLDDVYSGVLGGHVA